MENREPKPEDCNVFIEILEEGVEIHSEIHCKILVIDRRINEASIYSLEPNLELGIPFPEGVYRGR